MMRRPLFRLLSCLGLASCLAIGARADDKLPIPGQKPGTGPSLGQDEPPAVSDAEQISKLKRAIDSSQKRLNELIAERGDPQSEFAKAEAEFQKVDEELDRKKKALSALSEDGTPEKGRARLKLQGEIQAMEKSWKLAKDRFDLAIEERKTLKEQIGALEQKLERDHEALDRLTGASEPEGPASSKDKAAPTAKEDATPEPKSAKHEGNDKKPDGHSKHDASTTSDGKTEHGSETKDNAEPTDEPEGDPKDEELTKAKEQKKEKAEAAREAEQEQRSIAERLEALDKAIALEQRLVANSRRQSDNAQQTRNALSDDFRARSLDGAPQAELRELMAKVREAERRLQVTQQEASEHADRLTELESERMALLSQEMAAQKKAEQARAELSTAEAHVQGLKNPLHPRNLLPWVIDHGPRFLAIVLSMLGLHWCVKFFAHRIIRLIARGSARGSAEEREDRAKTLVGVFHNAASMSILGAGSMMALQEAGIPVAPLLGGAAVFGLAVAFGAQNLIRDYFYGFVILLENQYKLNDVVKLGNVSGQVEKITLRMTVLRDQEGSVHFIPNGQVNTVTNMTHGWSRALIDVGVAYKEDVDRVMTVLCQIGKELRQDPEFAGGILEDPTMLGVDSLGESAIVIRFYIKTKTLRQWPVRREMLRRIKNRFDELGIEIPCPQRALTVRAEDGPSTPAPHVTAPRRHDASHLAQGA
jgi:small conductance mechanosensitive channel